MTQIQAYENMSKEALIEHHLHTLQQHADDMDMLSKELASRSFVVPEDWQEQFKDEVYQRFCAADNQDVALEEYPEIALEVLDRVVGPRHPTVIKWRNDAIKQCIAIAYKYCRDPESHSYLKQDLEVMLAAAPAAPVAGPQLVQVYKINDLSGLVDSSLSQPCTCPSGDGSLRWPCPVHPPATDNLTKSSNQQMASKPPKTPQQIVASLRNLSERMKTVGASMSYFGGLNGAMDHHGRELAGAGAIAWDWADSIEQDISVGTASPTTDTTTHPA